MQMTEEMILPVTSPLPAIQKGKAAYYKDFSRLASSFQSRDCLPQLTLFLTSDPRTGLGVSFYLSHMV